MADEDNTEVDLDGLLEDSVKEGEDFPTEDVVGGDVDDLLDDIIGVPEPTEEEPAAEEAKASEAVVEAAATDAVAEEAVVEEEASAAAVVVEPAEPPVPTPTPTPTPAASQDKENTPNAKPPSAKKKSKPSSSTSRTAPSKKKPVTTTTKRTPTKPKTTPSSRPKYTPKPRPPTTYKPKTTPLPKAYDDRPKTPTRRRVPGPKSPKRASAQDGDDGDDDEPQGPICANTFQPNLHPKFGPCQICVFKLNPKEKAKFEVAKRHMCVNSTRGGCDCCQAFPSQEGEDPVRICRQCFFDTHKLAAPKYKPFSGVSTWQGLPVVQSNGKFVL